jgi:excisionase family DNA binding protein
VVAPGDLLSVRQVLQRLPVGRSTLYKLVAEGQIPAHRVRTAGGGRGRLLVHRDDLANYVARTRQRATRAPTNADVDDLLRKVRRNGGNRA